MARIEITEADLIADFQKALGDAETEDGWTSKELAQITGWSRSKVLDRMETLILAGSWERLNVMRESVNTGVTRPVNAYRPVQSRD